MSDLDGPRFEAKSGRPDSLIILVHGYGADGEDLIAIAHPFSSVLPNTSFASPDAPEPCRANPMGKQWFPITYIDGSSRDEMMEGFAKAQAALHRFIDSEMARIGVPASRVALVGFSQGTMLSLSVGLRRTEALAGIVGFSGLLLDPTELQNEIATKPPVLLVHGDSDDVVPAISMKEAMDFLEPLGVQVDGMLRDGLGHGIDEQGLVTAAEFLSQALSSN